MRNTSGSTLCLFASQSSRLLMAGSPGRSTAHTRNNDKPLANRIVSVDTICLRVRSVHCSNSPGRCRANHRLAFRPGAEENRRPRSQRRDYMPRTSVTQRRCPINACRWARSSSKAKIQGGIDTETGGDSHRIVLPVKAQAGHQRNRHNQQTHLQEPGGALGQDDPLEAPRPFPLDPWSKAAVARAAAAATPLRSTALSGKVVRNG